MNQFKISDNTNVKKTEIAHIQKLINRLSNRTLKQISDEGLFVFPEMSENLAGIEADQVILEQINDEYRTSNIMGFIGYGDDQLIISSRFAQKENDFFLQYMLQKVLDFPNITKLNSAENRDEQILNIFLFLFPIYLKAAVRKGLFKAYVNNQYNDSNIKGTINVARHILENTPFKGTIAYDKREYSYDNAIMELIRHTIEYIKSKPFGNKLLESVREEVSAVVDATQNYKIGDRTKVILENKKRPIYHAYYHEYRALQQLCILILRQEKHQMGFGERKIYGVLFDGAWLWEEYLNMLIGDAYYHPMNKAQNGAQKLFTNDKGYKKGRIYPDFISKDADNRVIADAKYKPVENIASHDYLQVLAYMFRFDANKGYYMYPDAEGKQSEVLWLNKGTSYESTEGCRTDISVEKYGLKIPQNADSYNQFVKEINVAETEFKKKFSIVI